MAMFAAVGVRIGDETGVAMAEATKHKGTLQSYSMDAHATLAGPGVMTLPPISSVCRSSNSACPTLSYLI